MKINRKIQILIILSILAIALATIGISANNVTNEIPQYQQNSFCPNTDGCPQQYYNYIQQSNWNYQSRSCCGLRT
ncbi:hypothetical protein ACFL1L_05125 [Thermoplasmatota archaeon]